LPLKTLLELLKSWSKVEKPLCFYNHSPAQIIISSDNGYTLASKHSLTVKGLEMLETQSVVTP
jgi:hypothetical protein